MGRGWNWEGRGRVANKRRKVTVRVGYAHNRVCVGYRHDFATICMHYTKPRNIGCGIRADSREGGGKGMQLLIPSD